MFATIGAKASRWRRYWKSYLYRLDVSITRRVFGLKQWTVLYVLPMVTSMTSFVVDWIFNWGLGGIPQPVKVIMSARLRDLRF